LEFLWTGEVLREDRLLEGIQIMVYGGSITFEEEVWKEIMCERIKDVG
jgi:hypothetical protein